MPSAKTRDGGSRRPGEEVDDDPAEHLPPILLEEVPGARDRRVRLARRAGHRLLEEPVPPARDRVLVAERGEEGLPPPAEDLPGLPVRAGRRVVGPDRNEHRELPRAGL